MRARKPCKENRHSVVDLFAPYNTAISSPLQSGASTEHPSSHGRGSSPSEVNDASVSCAAAGAGASSPRGSTFPLGLKCNLLSHPTKRCCCGMVVRC